MLINIINHFLNELFEQPFKIYPTFINYLHYTTLIYYFYCNLWYIRHLFVFSLYKHFSFVLVSINIYLILIGKNNIFYFSFNNKIICMLVSINIQKHFMLIIVGDSIRVSEVV